ncbi:hypothetical protein B0H19DRAFT_1263527 [Mycena capillaripes]|nr:hypothetical protein B0H19DRAFT_1263527 [Mycena capillaripes]
MGERSQDTILATLAPYASQWMSLDLDAFRPILFPVDSVFTPLPSLKRLKIRVQGWPADAPTSITAFLDAPQLRMVHLNGLRFSRISLPWIQLTSLTLWCRSAAETFEFLHHTPNLEHLDLYMGFWQYSDTLAPPLMHPANMLVSSTLSPFLPSKVCNFHPYVAETCDCISNLPSLTKTTIRFSSWSKSDYTRFFELVAEFGSKAILPALEVLNMDGASENEASTIEISAAADIDWAPKLTTGYIDSKMLEVLAQDGTDERV